MQFKSTISLGGVPEHFNFPWKIWINQMDVKQEEFNWVWNDFPGGSGAMIQSLEYGEIDVAIVLTEALANAKIKGLDLIPLSTFVKSPLVWGVFTSADNPTNKIGPMENMKIAISRFGSGSELMAKVFARERSEILNESNFVIVNNLEGGRLALLNGDADLFFWEKWMTKPLVDSSELKMIGEIPTPWPCFLAVCKPKFYNNELKMKAFMNNYLKVLEIAKGLKQGEATHRELSRNYGLKPDDAKEWLSKVEWANGWETPAQPLDLATATLQEIYSLN